MPHDFIAAAMDRWCATHIQQNGRTPNEDFRATDHAKWFEKVRKMSPGVQRRKIRMIRAKIAEGVYENYLKFDVAAGRLLDDLEA